MHLDITTPESAIFTGEVDSVSLPTPEGEITILPHHIPLIGIVAAGSILVRTGHEEHLFAVSRGVVEIDGTTIRVLTDTADRAEELEEEAILRAKAEAEKLLTERRDDRERVAELTAVLERELAKLNVVRRRRSRRTPPSGT